MYNFDKATGGIVVPQSAIAQVSPLYPKSIPVRAGNPNPAPAKGNFRPRFSAAYRLGPKFVLRGGYRQFTERISLFQRVGGGGPFQIGQTYQNQANQVPQFAFPNPLPTNLALSTVASQSVTFYPDSTRNGVLHQYNISLEHEIASIGLRASYIGNLGRGLNYSLNTNIPEPSLISFGASRRPYPSLVNVTEYRSDGSSSFQSFQMEAKRRTGSITFDFNYSYAVTRNNFSNLENPYDVLSKWANDANTRRHYAVGSAVWEVPVGTGRRFWSRAPKALDLVAGQWQLYWLSYIGSGTFFSPSFSGSSPSNTGVNGGLPDKVGDPYDLPQTYTQWFEAKAFAVPPAGRFGNALPNSLESQPLRVHHLSAAKRFRFNRAAFVHAHRGSIEPVQPSAVHLADQQHLGGGRGRVHQRGGRLQLERARRPAPDDAQREGSISDRPFRPSLIN